MLAQCTHRHAIRGVARHDELPGVCRRGRALRRRPARGHHRAGRGRRALPGRRAARDGAARRLPRAVLRALRTVAVPPHARGDGGPCGGIPAAARRDGRGGHGGRARRSRRRLAAAGPARGDRLAEGALRPARRRELLRRLFPEDDIRLFEGAPVFFQCTCSRERVAGILQALGGAEVNALLAERGDVEVRCEFCNRAWRFDAVDVAGLFSAGAPQPAPRGLH